MPHAILRFPGRRYHATPWNSHVNEGLVEWPPSPWRICRALIATGFSKLGWVESAIPADAVALLEALAEEPPTYRLPPAITSHSRHYMPIAGGNTTKVFDTFAHVGDQELGITWPVELTSSQESLLEVLLAHMGYLGRAESWVAAEFVEESDLPDHPLCRASGHGDPAVFGWEQVPLIAPIPRSEYSRWRERALGDAIATAGDGLSARGRETVEAKFPSDLWACLTRRTNVLQKDGWSQPPGSRMLLFERRQDALSSWAPSPRSPRRAQPRVECALIALSSDTSRGEVLPQMLRCLPQAELIHRSLVSLAAQVSKESCPELSGRDASGDPATGHRHAHYLPLDLDQDGRLDHFLIHTPMGMGDVAQRAIGRLRRTWTKGRSGDLFVAAVGLGDRGDIGAALLGQRNDPGLLDLAVNWISHTPFIAPRHVKRHKHSLESQVRAELADRGFPEPSSIEVGSREALLASGFLNFVRERRQSAKRPPTTQPWLLRLCFAEPVPGPIAIGYGCHYGLGVFRPFVDRSTDLVRSTL